MHGLPCRQGSAGALSRGSCRRLPHVPVAPIRLSMPCASGTTEAPCDVVIRRKAPFGSDKHACGPFDFRIDMLEENKPQNILEEIVWWKAKEIENMRNKTSLATLLKLSKVAPPARDFRGAVLRRMAETGKPGLIAEVKKASPSKGIIQPDFDPVRIAQAYERGGAACLSVLTDEKYFMGSFENLQKIRAAGVQCPLLCKEFIVEAYQVYKARASGADAILLIAAVLPNQDLSYLTKAAAGLGMQVLIEVHSVTELARVLELGALLDQSCLLGINNRDLGTFKVDLELTTRIMQSAPGKQVTERKIPMVGESGIFTPDHVASVQAAGCSGILVGESLVKQGDPELGVKTLLSLA